MDMNRALASWSMRCITLYNVISNIPYRKKPIAFLSISRCCAQHFFDVSYIQCDTRAVFFVDACKIKHWQRFIAKLCLLIVLFVLRVDIAGNLLVRQPTRNWRWSYTTDRNFDKIVGRESVDSRMLIGLKMAMPSSGYICEHWMKKIKQSNG